MWYVQSLGEVIIQSEPEPDLGCLQRIRKAAVSVSTSSLRMKTPKNNLETHYIIKIALSPVSDHRIHIEVSIKIEFK